jgi:hypothetical protein
MLKTNQWLVGLILAITAWGVLACGDIEKYQKPAEQAQPESTSLDLKGTPEEQAAGREFTARLEGVRAALAEKRDTLAAVIALDSLFIDAEQRWSQMPAASEFRSFYLILMADILNQNSSLKMRTGDTAGAREARRRLFEISRQLPK